MCVQVPERYADRNGGYTRVVRTVRNTQAMSLIIHGPAQQWRNHFAACFHSLLCRQSRFRTDYFDRRDPVHKRGRFLFKDLALGSQCNAHIYCHDLVEARTFTDESHGSRHTNCCIFQKHTLSICLSYGSTHTQTLTLSRQRARRLFEFHGSAYTHDHFN